tara:strand:+ start:58145 stop:60790 length:2646 start_codon:yes stop_codon:yes gene_type:complete
MSNLVSDKEPPQKLPKSNYIDLIERERDILLGIGKDITRIRDKDDLISFFSKRLKSMFHFTHTIVSLIDRRDETYAPFLLNHEASPIRHHKEYDLLSQSRFSLNEPFIQSVLNAKGASSYIVRDIMDNPQSPPFLRVNYEGGVREILMTALWSADKPIGFVHIYSDRTDSFTQEFRSIINGISPQLSNAVSNIIKNEDLKNKEYEKSFLLDFSNDIAAVRNKSELGEAVHKALKKIPSIQDYIIRKIDPMEENLTTYIYDSSMGDKIEDPLFAEIVALKFPLNDGLNNRVLDSYIPLLFNVNREIERGITSKYLMYWQKMGITKVAGIALRNGELNLGILWLAIDEINISLLKGICDQISTAMANIMANEAMVELNKSQSVLLQFSNEIAGMNNSTHLEDAIIKVLRDVLHTKLAMIRKFDDDEFFLVPYIYDRTLFNNEMEHSLYQERMAAKIDCHEYYNAKVIKSREPIVFNIEEELKSTKSPYNQLWKCSGYKNAYGALLSVGETKIGTLWLLADYLNPSMLKGICSQIAVAIDNLRVNEKLLRYKRQLEDENIYLKEQITEIYNFKEIIGSGDNMQKVYHLMSIVAESNSTVLVLGETGTGKELIARAIHNASPRHDKLMIKVNCAAMPANLIESELFGHEKGSFTGATERRIGKFELANNGTLFLDEIGEMPLESQVKLLRVIQEREFERIGGKDTIKVNVRIIAATNRELRKEVDEGRFRSDLYYRLNVFPISLPPLRERMEDLDLLANFFVKKYNKNTGKNIEHISRSAMQKLRSYSWPGNIRELEHLIERSLLMATDTTLKEVYLPIMESSQEVHPNFGKSLNEVEKSYIIETLKNCNGKISGTDSAAELLKIPGNTLHSKMKKLGITKSDYF